MIRIIETLYVGHLASASPLRDDTTECLPVKPLSDNPGGKP